jgi:pyruvate/2-oxoglutarate dehydrogenase complex dihydrolipoamide dehydrogenase (E3) component
MENAVMEEVDVVVLGLGVGGEEVAGRLAQAGLAVVGIEDRLVGGECPYWGCIPTKMMIRAANLVAETRRVNGFSGGATVRPEWAPVARRIRDEATHGWSDQLALDRLVGKGGRFVRGRGRITAPGEVTVRDQVFRTRRGIVVAVGTSPALPPIAGLNDMPYWTSREAVEVEQLPRILAVIGGGAIGTEFAQVFSRFGVAVTILEAADRLLSYEEPEAGALVKEAFAAEGITVHTGKQVDKVHHYGERELFEVTLDSGEELFSERLLVAAGRRAVLTSLGVDLYGADDQAAALPVDDRMRVADGLWAVGDVTGLGAFTHVAMYQADVAVRNILGQDGPPAEYDALPRVTFTDPEVGAVGLTERQAREVGLAVRVGMTDIRSSSRGWVHGSGNAGFIKLVEDADRGVLVGATSVGPNGGEVLGALSVAIHGRVPTDRLQHMIYAYPTFHRAIGDAVRNLAAPE